MNPKPAEKAYPDIADILARKAQGKREASKRTFAEKIAMVESLNERLAPLKAAREARKRAGGKSKPATFAGKRGQSVDG